MAVKALAFSNVCALLLHLANGFSDGTVDVGLARLAFLLAEFGI
jgi:hypothetical protein